MEDAFCFAIGSDISRLPDVAARLEDLLAASGFSSDAIFDIQLAVEEVLTNVITHGYRGGPGEIRIQGRISGDGAEIGISDTAPPFDPLALPEPDLSGDLAGRPAGGLGIFLLRQVVDDARYRREGERNVLTLFKKKIP